MENLKKQFTIEGDLGELLGWCTLSQVFDTPVFYMDTLEEARDTLQMIKEKYGNKLTHEYRIVSRSVTPWEVEK